MGLSAGALPNSPSTVGTRRPMTAVGVATAGAGRAGPRSARVGPQPEPTGAERPTELDATTAGGHWAVMGVLGGSGGSLGGKGGSGTRRFWNAARASDNQVSCLENQVSQVVQPHPNGRRARRVEGKHRGCGRGCFCRAQETWEGRSMAVSVLNNAMGRMAQTDGEDETWKRSN